MLKKKIGKLLCCALTIGILMSSNAICASAITNEKNIPKEIVVLENSNNDKAFALPNDVINKQECNNGMEKYLNDSLKQMELQMKSSTKQNFNSLAATRSNKSYSIGDSQIKYSKTATMLSKFNSTISWDNIKTSKISGNSTARFTGTYGYSPNKIALTDTFNFVGVGVSVSAGGPNWSSTKSTAKWSRTASNTSALYHEYSNVTCVGHDLYIKQITTASFDVGNTTYEVNASDSKLL